MESNMENDMDTVIKYSYYMIFSPLVSRAQSFIPGKKEALSRVKGLGL